MVGGAEPAGWEQREQRTVPAGRKQQQKQDERQCATPSAAEQFETLSLWLLLRGAATATATAAAVVVLLLGGNWT